MQLQNTLRTRNKEGCYGRQAREGSGLEGFYIRMAGIRVGKSNGGWAKAAGGGAHSGTHSRGREPASTSQREVN